MYGRFFLQRMYGDIYIISHISVVNDPIQTKNYTFITSHIKKLFTEFQSKRSNIRAVRINYLILFILYLVCVTRGNRTNKISAIFFMFVCVCGGTTRCTIDCQVVEAECHVNCSQSTILRLMPKSTQKPLDGDNTGQGVIFDHANKRCAV